MSKRLRPKLTYANVIASIALFVALSGAAVAATALPRNSVGTKQLKSGAVTAGKLRKSAVTAGKLAPKSVVAGKLGPSAVTPGNLGKGVVGTEKIAEGAVLAKNIKNGVVTANKLANESVTTAKLGKESVTNAKIGPEVAPLLGTLKSGQTLRGFFDAGGRSGGAQGQTDERWSTSFQFPLVNPPAATETNILNPGESSTACPGLKGGNGQTPEAAAGQLCVYIVKSQGYSDSNFDLESVTRLGFGLLVSFTNEPENDHYLRGFWAVTAP
jgi:hypothetical protein